MGTQKEREIPFLLTNSTSITHRITTSRSEEEMREDLEKVDGDFWELDDKHYKRIIIGEECKFYIERG